MIQGNDRINRKRELTMNNFYSFILKYQEEYLLKRLNADERCILLSIFGLKHAFNFGMFISKFFYLKSIAPQ